MLQITQPTKYRCTPLQYRFAVISEAPSKFTHLINSNFHTEHNLAEKKLLTIYYFLTD